MVDVVGTFNNVVSYLSSVGSKLGDIFGKIGNCLMNISWSDLWTSPKTNLNETINGIFTEFKKLWNTLMGYIFGSSKDDDDNKKDTQSKKRRRRHVLE